MSVFYNQHSELYKYRQLCDLADIITIAICYNIHFEVYSYRQLCDMADIITLAVFYNRQSELDKYRQLSGIADILITLVVFYNQHSLSISSVVWYGRHNNYPSYALLPTFWTLWLVCLIGWMCLTPLSKIFQLSRMPSSAWKKKPEYPICLKWMTNFIT